MICSGTKSVPRLNAHPVHGKVPWSLSGCLLVSGCVRVCVSVSVCGGCVRGKPTVSFLKHRTTPFPRVSYWRDSCSKLSWPGIPCLFLIAQVLQDVFWESNSCPYVIRQALYLIDKLSPQPGLLPTILLALEDS